MKVLSLLQPWASLVVAGHKKIETRSWNTKFRGRLLIHASLGKAYRKIPTSDPFWKHYHMLFAKDEMAPIEQLPYGAIIGSVNIVCTAKTQIIIPDNEVIMVCDEEFDAIHLTEKERAFGDYSPGRYGWLLSDPILFDTPIPCKGHLGIWNAEKGIDLDLLPQ